MPNTLPRLPRTNLLVFRDRAGAVQPVRSKADWQQRRAEIIRGLDLLQALPCVRKGKLGAIGHSLGGHNAIYTAVFDPRIKVVVSSCGFDAFADYYEGDPANWQPERGWCQTRYMPRLADYRGRLADIPFDSHELLGALAPRPVFVNAPLRDGKSALNSLRKECTDCRACCPSRVSRCSGGRASSRALIFSAFQGSWGSRGRSPSRFGGWATRPAVGGYKAWDFPNTP